MGDLSWDHMRFDECSKTSGSEALGGSFVRVLRVGEALGGRGSNDAMRRCGSAKERPSRAWGEGEGGEARSVVFYEGLWLWEARFVVFYESLRLWGGLNV